MSDATRASDERVAEATGIVRRNMMHTTLGVIGWYDALAEQVAQRDAVEADRDAANARVKELETLLEPNPSRNDPHTIGDCFETWGLGDEKTIRGPFTAREVYIREGFSKELSIARNKSEGHEQSLGNLLCLIHRDGGHYIAKHGWDKAIKDAETVILDWRTSHDRMKELEALSQERLERIAGLEARLAGPVEGEAAHARVKELEASLGRIIAASRRLQSARDPRRWGELEVERGDADQELWATIEAVAHVKMGMPREHSADRAKLVEGETKDVTWRLRGLAEGCDRSAERTAKSTEHHELLRDDAKALRRAIDLIVSQARELAELREQACRFYHADGTYETLTPEQVIAKRIDAAKEIATLREQAKPAPEPEAWLPEPIADVRLCMGRQHLFVGGIVVATEGDSCRHMTPVELSDPIPEEELEHATIGGEPIKSMDPETVRFFRGEQWRPKTLEWAADQINAKAQAAAAHMLTLGIGPGASSKPREGG